MTYDMQYPIRINVRMTEEQRDTLQHHAHRLGLSSSALMRVMINQLNNNTNPTT
mgnify:CR=1 FL=1